jgi:RecA-family ATPase
LGPIALSLTAARPVWGFYSCRDPRRVGHVDFEQGERLTRIRYKRLARAMGIDLASLGDAIALAVMPPIKLAREHASHWRRLMTGRDLIIVDSLRAATAGEDENSSQIRGALDMLGEVSERTGCRALIIHHARVGPLEGFG